MRQDAEETAKKARQTDTDDASFRASSWFRWEQGRFAKWGGTGGGADGAGGGGPASASAWARNAGDFKQKAWGGVRPPPGNFNWANKEGASAASGRREGRVGGGQTQATHYSVLGVSPTATESEIKKAFHKLALLFHPDKVPEEDKIKTEEKFKLINTAYSILMDRTQRRQYDLSFSDY